MRTRAQEVKCGRAAGAAGACAERRWAILSCSAAGGATAALATADGRVSGWVTQMGGWATPLTGRIDGRHTGMDDTHRADGKDDTGRGRILHMSRAI